MLILGFSKINLKKHLIICIIAATLFIMVASVILTAVHQKKHTLFINGKEYSANIRTSADLYDFAENLGIKLSTEQVHSKDIIIPYEFSDILEYYNSLQIKTGSDLRRYKGKKCTLFTFSISDYEKDKKRVMDIITYNGFIIAADIRNENIPGNIVGF